jgi:hypothetical protein
MAEEVGARDLRADRLRRPLHSAGKRRDRALGAAVGQRRGGRDLPGILQEPLGRSRRECRSRGQCEVLHRNVVPVDPRAGETTDPFDWDRGDLDVRHGPLSPGFARERPVLELGNERENIGKVPDRSGSVQWRSKARFHGTLCAVGC